MGDKIKHLSDAILLGSTFRKQSFQDLYVRGRSCAIGAAAEAIGINIIENADDNYYVEQVLEARFPAMESAESDCPCKGCSEANVRIHDMVVHLNDKHHWKRERIAAWLQTKGL